MFNTTTLLLGLRYARARRRHQFIAFVSVFSFLGMALGTMALILVTSVMNGFGSEITSRILAVVPHGFIEQQDPMQDWQLLASRVERHPKVVATAPYIREFVMLNSTRKALGVELQAILPERERSVSIDPSLHRLECAFYLGEPHFSCWRLIR